MRFRLQAGTKYAIPQSIFTLGGRLTGSKLQLKTSKVDGPPVESRPTGE